MTRIMLLATGAALAVAVASPAMAQDAESDAATEAALNQNNVMTVRNIARTELAHGLPVYDASGTAVGTVGRLAGNDVILSDEGREYRVPITDFFAYNQYGKDYIATRTPKAAIEAQAPAGGTQ